MITAIFANRCLDAFPRRLRPIAAQLDALRLVVSVLDADRPQMGRLALIRDRDLVNAILAAVALFGAGFLYLQFRWTGRHNDRRTAAVIRLVGIAGARFPIDLGAILDVFCRARRGGWQLEFKIPFQRLAGRKRRLGDETAGEDIALLLADRWSVPACQLEARKQLVLDYNRTCIGLRPLVCDRDTELAQRVDAAVEDRDCWMRRSFFNHQIGVADRRERRCTRRRQQLRRNGYAGDVVAAICVSCRARTGSEQPFQKGWCNLAGLWQSACFFKIADCFAGPASRNAVDGPVIKSETGEFHLHRADGIRIPCSLPEPGEHGAILPATDIRVSRIDESQRQGGRAAGAQQKRRPAAIDLASGLLAIPGPARRAGHGHIGHRDRVRNKQRALIVGRPQIGHHDLKCAVESFRAGANNPFVDGEVGL